MQNRCCGIGCFFNNSSKAHAHYLSTLMILCNFISPRAFAVYMENSLRFQISLRSNWPNWNLYRNEFYFAEVMWTLIMKLPYTEVRFTTKWNLKAVWVHFGSHVNVLIVMIVLSISKSERLVNKEVVCWKLNRLLVMYKQIGLCFISFLKKAVRQQYLWNLADNEMHLLENHVFFHWYPWRKWLFLVLNS